MTGLASLADRRDSASLPGWPGKFYRRQSEAAARIEREVIFNDKILANMPSGIALVDPESRRFLQANEAFGQMARRFGDLAGGKRNSRSDLSKKSIFAPPGRDRESSVLWHALPTRRATTGRSRRHNEFRERQPASPPGFEAERAGRALFLVEDKTRDVRLRQELISANAAKDQFLALLSHELRNPLSPVIAMVGELEARAPDERGTPPAARSDSAQRRIGGAIDRRSARHHPHRERQSCSSASKSRRSTKRLRRAYEICREDIRQKNLDSSSA